MEKEVFKFADPIIHKGNFYFIQKKYMNTVFKSESNLSKYNFLLKLYDKAEIIKSK